MAHPVANIDFFEGDMVLVRDDADLVAANVEFIDEQPDTEAIVVRIDNPDFDNHRVKINVMSKDIVSVMGR